MHRVGNNLQRERQSQGEALVLPRFADSSGIEAQQDQQERHAAISMDIALLGGNPTLFQLQGKTSSWKKGCGVFSQSPFPEGAAVESPGPTGNVTHGSWLCWGSALGSSPPAAVPSLECFTYPWKCSPPATLLLAGPDEL